LRTNRPPVESTGDPAKANGDILGVYDERKIERRTHIFEREEADHDVEPSRTRLFEVERFP
jgi:hypothetical protein